ncbi:hypothetical protein FG379_001148 [Cryptosporidium bovis]|uniref:uncharacterized protein n=1 Tax=Cryptosporidium bovis TaxID=310047 RepID=UPI00351A957B|nr:hypothetical protein FG379_001148 [Cryptosporidium bovis]
MDRIGYFDAQNLKIGIYRAYWGESNSGSLKKELKTEGKHNEKELTTPVSNNNTIISNNGWFQLYTSTKSIYGRKEYEENEYLNFDDELADKIYDSVVLSLEHTMNNGGIELEISYLEARAIINQIKLEILKGMNIGSENNNGSEFPFDLNKISRESFLRHEKMFDIPLINVIICNFDNSPSVNSVSLERKEYYEILKLCEISCEFGEIDFILLGISVSRSQEIEKQSKKNFEKLKNELYRLFGHSAKDKCIWFSGTNQQYDTNDVLFTNQIKQVTLKIVEQLEPVINYRIKSVIDFALTLRNDGPKPFHSLKIRLSSERNSIESRESDLLIENSSDVIPVSPVSNSNCNNYFNDVGNNNNSDDYNNKNANIDLTICSSLSTSPKEYSTSGIHSPVNSCRNTKCRKLQISDIWYQWILDIINTSDLLALTLFKIGLVNEALLIYEQILEDFKVKSDNFIVELKNQSFGFAELIELKDPLILASDCCIGDCRTHSVENSALIRRDNLILPLRLSILKLGLRSTYFDIIQLVFSRKLVIFLSIGELQKISNRFDLFIKKFLKEIVNKIDDYKFKIASHFWIFRLAITVVSVIQNTNDDSNKIFENNTNNQHLLYNISYQSTPSPIYNLKISLISSLLPRLMKFLGESESYDVLKHKPSAPKLPPDTNVTPMEVQIALIKWATQCISSILLNNICNINEFGKTQIDVDKNEKFNPDNMKEQNLNMKANDSSHNHTKSYYSCITINSASSISAHSISSSSSKTYKKSNNSSTLQNNYSILHIAAKHLSVITQIISKNIWNNQNLSSSQKQSLIESFFLYFNENRDIKSNIHPNDDYNNNNYDLRELSNSLFSPFKAYRMLCEITGVTGMEYISLGFVKSAISLTWGVLFENKEFVDWIIKIVNDDNYLSIATFEKRNSILSDISFCYRFSRIWLDFTTILLPIPFQWTILNSITKKMLLKFLIKRNNPILKNYVNFNDPYILQAEIGIRLFLNQTKKKDSKLHKDNLYCNSNFNKIRENDEYDYDCSENEENEYDIIETYVKKCLDNSNVLDEDCKDHLQWEFPANPNIWAYIFVQESNNSESNQLKNDDKTPVYKFRAKVTQKNIESISSAYSCDNEVSQSDDLKRATQVKTNKGATLKIVERQILTVLLGGGRLIKLPHKALPCCGLLDPLKPIQGYFYVFHEILRPSGRLFLKSPYVLSPLQSPLGSSTNRLRIIDEYDDECCTNKLINKETVSGVNNSNYINCNLSDSNDGNNNIFVNGIGTESSIGNKNINYICTDNVNFTDNSNGKYGYSEINNGETQKIEQEEAKDEISTSKNNNIYNSKTITKSSNYNGNTNNSSNNNNCYNGWFHKKSSKHERSYSLTNSESEHFGIRKKDGSPKQWMWEIVSGLKWGSNYYGSSSKSKNKTNSFTTENLLERNQISDEINNELSKSTKKSNKDDYSKTKNQRSPTLNLGLKVDESSSPTKVITVPTPGPSNWVITETGRSNLSKKSHHYSPNSMLEMSENNIVPCSVIPSNTLIDKSTVPGIPIKFCILIYIGLENSIKFNSVWLRVNNCNWILLENIYNKDNRIINNNHITLKPGINKIEIDVLYDGPTSSKLTINSIGFSSINGKGFKLPINFLWVVPLGTLPSPHILSKVTFKFERYEHNIQEYNEFSSLNKLSYLINDYNEYNKDNSWNPLKKWTTLYSFNPKKLTEIINLKIEPLQKSDKKTNIDNINFQTDGNFNLIDYKKVIESNIMAQSCDKSWHMFIITIDNNWTQVNYVDLKVTIDLFSCNNNNSNIKVYLDELELISIDGNETNNKLYLNLDNMIEIPKFLKELVFKVPLMFSFSPIESLKTVCFEVNLSSKLLDYTNVYSNSTFKFNFLIEPQAKLQNIQKVPNIYRMSIPFYYFEIFISGSSNVIVIDKLIFAYQKNTKDLHLFNILTAVPIETSKDVKFDFIDESMFIIEYKLKTPIAVEYDCKPLKFVWIVPKNQLANNPKPLLYISSFVKGSNYENPNSISGPFEVSIEKYKTIFALKESIYTNLNCIYLEKVDYPPQSRIDVEFVLLVNLKYTSDSEETFCYCLEIDKSVQNYNNSVKGTKNWWFIGSRNGVIRAKPNSDISLEFKVVPLKNGIIDLPNLHIGKITSNQNKRIFPLGKQIVL